MNAALPHALPERALDVFRRVGNPFRNYFARNPDDEVCARYHVHELFAREREQLLAIVDLYRCDSGTHSEVVPVLGNKGAGKTHLLHSIKHGERGCVSAPSWQMLVTPGTYQKDTEFLEYLLFQVIDTLLGGGKQKGARPLEFIGDDLVARLTAQCLAATTKEDRLSLFPAPGLGNWARKLGFGSSAAQERTQWLISELSARSRSTRSLCEEAGLTPALACEKVCAFIDKVEAHNTAGLMRRHIHQGFCRAVLLGEEADLANFLTFGFAELDFKVRPTRQDLVLALFKVLMEVFRSLKVPVVVAFDQLEDLLLARRADDGHRVAEAFFAGIVQAMHQIDGLCFLVFAERGLWNRFVPSLDGYIQDRLNNPIHVPQHGTIKTLRLEAPPADLAMRVVEARLRPSLSELADAEELTAIFPFTEEQVLRVARTEPTLRDMLQQYRHLFDHLVYGSEDVAVERPTDRIQSEQPPVVKSVIVVETPASRPDTVPAAETPPSPQYSVLTPPRVEPAPSPATLNLGELWEQELRSARRQLEPEGAITGATRELQAGLGAFLRICHEHGVKVGPWRLQHVVPEWTFGDHPTYGAITIAHWACKDGQPWKVGVGLWLGRGPAKPKDLEKKLGSFEVEPAVIDHLILLRPEDDLALNGKSKTLWQEAERKGRHTRMEALSLEGFAAWYGFPRWLTAVTEALPSGQPLPNLADLLQDRCERLLQQVCMPVQGG